MPGDHSVHFALSMPTAMDDGSAHLNLGIMIEPLLAQHGDKRGKEGSSQTAVKDGLDADDNGVGAHPFRKNGIGASWDSPKLDAGDNLEKIVAHLLVIWLEVLLNVNNENGCNCGEQTCLYPHENCINTAAEICAKRMLTKIKVVFKSSSDFFIMSRQPAIIPVGKFMLEFVVGFDAGAAGSPEEVQREGWQCLEHGLLQT